MTFNRRLCFGLGFRVENLVVAAGPRFRVVSALGPRLGSALLIVRA